MNELDLDMAKSLMVKLNFLPFKNRYTCDNYCTNLDLRYIAWSKARCLVKFDIPPRINYGNQTGNVWDIMNLTELKSHHFLDYSELIVVETEDRSMLLSLTLLQTTKNPEFYPQHLTERLLAAMEEQDDSRLDTSTASKS